MTDPHVNEVAVMDPLAARKAAAEARVAEALAAMEEARRQIDRATEALCSVRGMASEWKRLGALCEKVKTARYRVMGQADSLVLKGRLLFDHEPSAREGEWARERLS